MPEIRIHGRGGQGAVVASRVLAEAAFLEGRYVQSFPAFGLERRGAPVTAFTRIQDSPIRNHSQIYRPDAVVVLDAGLLKLVNVCDGLVEGGTALVNTTMEPEEIPLPSGISAAAVNAGAIAVKHGLGNPLSPIVNTAIIGAFAKVTAFISIDSATRAIRNVVSMRPDANVKACIEAYESVKTAHTLKH